VDEAGAIYVAFGAQGAVYCCKSTDGGETFSKPVKIGEAKKLALGKRRGPRIVASKNAVVVTAISHEDGDVLSWRSNDGGETWSVPRTVNDNSPGTAAEGLHALAISPQGEVFCTWLDHRLARRKQQIFGAVSRDGGKTWGENMLVYRSPSGGICPCCHPSATYDAKGGLHVMWRNELDGFRDMYVASSSDGGETFQAAVKLGAGSWRLDACPMDGGALAATSPGKLTTVWRRERQIYRTQPDQLEEQLLGDGEQPWAAATSQGAYVVWLNRRPGDLMFLGPKSGRAIKLTAQANDPVVAAPLAGKGPVVVVWETGHGDQTGILATVVGE
jgi:hypothetical protein